MAPLVATAQLRLSYPPYAADFDPWDNRFLMVGGGGGEVASGVGNKIVSFSKDHQSAGLTSFQTLIDTSRKHEINELVDVDLRKDEDSVTSLSVVSSEYDHATVFAGINSSTADQNAGKNEHLRWFKMTYPRRKKVSDDNSPEKYETLDQGQTKGTEAFGRTSLFTPDSREKKETYQRVLRLSPVRNRGEGRLAAIASGLAQNGEVVTFSISQGQPLLPSQDEYYKKFDLGEGTEAGDVDIICADPTDSAQYRVAYCTDYEVHLAKINREGPPQKACVYTVPHPDAFASASSRPKLRSLRFLSPNSVLILQNYPNRTGAELLVLQLSSVAMVEGNVLLRRRLRKSVKSATTLTTCILAPKDPRGTTQTVIAVAGQDNSITVLTLDHLPTVSFGKLKFREYAYLRDIHPLLITTLTLACIIQPRKDASQSPPQYIKLASTSMANTVVVHTLPLSPYPAPDSQKPVERYVLIAPGHDEAWQMALSVIISAIVIAIGAFSLQAFTEIRGGTPEFLGAKSWLPQRVHGWVARPYMFEDISSVASTASTTVASASGSASGTIMDTVNDIVDSATDSALSVTREGQASASSAIHDAQSSAQSVTHHIVSLLQSHHQAQATASSSPDTASRQAVLISHDPDSDSIHAEQHEAETLSQDGKHKAMRWEQLSEHEKQKWKKRLADAGHLAEAQAEAVLKGVFFSSVAQAIGAAVG